VRGNDGTPRVALIENLLFAEERVGVRTLDRKYVRWDNGKEEVYDLTADPREQRDVVGLDAYLRPLRELYALEQNTTAPSLIAARPFVEPSEAAALHALGYVQ